MLCPTHIGSFGPLADLALPISASNEGICDVSGRSGR